MSKKRRRKDRKVVRAHGGRPVERLELGPLTLTRVETSLITDFHMDPEEHRLGRERAWATRGQWQENFRTARDQLVAILRQYSPLAILDIALVSLVRTQHSADEWATGPDRFGESHLEYLVNVVAAVATPLGAPEAPSDVSNRALALVLEVFENASYSFQSEATNPDVKPTDELRFREILRRLYYRGSSYRHHHRALVVAIYGGHDERLRARLGFTASELVDAADEIERQIDEHLRKTAGACLGVLELQQRFREWSDSSGIQGVTSVGELREAFLRLPGVAASHAEIGALFEQSADLSLLRPCKVLPLPLLDALSMRPGDNVAFLEPPVSGSPLNRGGSHVRPLLRIGDGYFAPSPSLLVRNLESILDRAFLDDEGRLDQGFARARHAALLRQVANQFRRLLPGCFVHENLFYRMDPSSRSELFEVDLIVEFHEYLFVVEVKGGQVREEAQRGSLRAIENAIEAILEEAFAQATRVVSFIEDNPQEANFLDARGEVVLSLRSGRFVRKHEACVTLSDLRHYTAQIGHLQMLGSVRAGPVPWAVFVNDLEVIADIIESPAEFLLYLEKRLRVQTLQNLNVVDELDLLMYFIDRGLDLDAQALADFDFFQLHGFTDLLDRYYMGVWGEGDAVEKPKRRVDPGIRNLVTRIEACESPGRFEAALHLLSLGEKDQRVVAEKIDSLKEAVLLDGRSHGSILCDVPGARRLSLVVGPSSGTTWIQQHRDRNRIRKYQARIPRLIGIMIVADTDGEDEAVIVDFQDYEWVRSAEMDQRVRAFQIEQTGHAIAKGGRPGRNAMCPCASGLKFKRCCGPLF